MFCILYTIVICAVMLVVAGVLLAAILEPILFLLAHLVNIIEYDWRTKTAFAFIYVFVLMPLLIYAL